MISSRALIADLLGYDPDGDDAAARIRARPDVLVAAAACAPGEVVPAQDAGAPVAVVRLDDGRAFVVDDACPHDGGPLSDGYVEGERLVCSRHNWEFDPSTGRCTHRAACIEARPLVPLSLRRPDSGGALATVGR